jgi:hypothetical protein
MRATLLIGTLVLMAACAEQTAYQDPAPTSAGAGGSYAQAQPSPCKRSDYPEGAAGDTEYTNCIIQN